MPLQQQHRMILSGDCGRNTAEWSCPTCGRRIVLRMPPDYALLVLERGDETAIHTGSRGGISMGVEVVPPVEGFTAEDRRWLQDLGIQEAP